MMLFLVKVHMILIQIFLRLIKKNGRNPKVNCFKVKNSGFKMIRSRGNVIEVTKINVKIYDLTREVFFFVLDNPDFDYEFLIDLDLVCEFSYAKIKTWKFLKILKGTGSVLRLEETIFLHLLNQAGWKII